MRAIFHRQISTTLGEMTLTRGPAGLTGLYFPNHWHPPTREALGRTSNAGFDMAIEQLSEYLDGKRQEFDLDFDVRGDTFELSVWEQIRTIPYGTTATYGELAGRLGDGVSPRIVGGAVGRNPLSIFIPCHRRHRQQRETDWIRGRTRSQADPARSGIGRRAAPHTVLSFERAPASRVDSSPRLVRPNVARPDLRNSRFTSTAVDETGRCFTMMQSSVQGPKAPFSTIVEQHGPTVLRVCRAILGPADADDAWSETFLSALRAYPELPASANVEAWLVTIAHRRAIDVARASARRAIPIAEVPDVASVTHVTTGVVDLEDALSSLPAKQKQALVYHYLADLPYAEVASIIGGTAEAARRAASDAVASLRKRGVLRQLPATGKRWT